MIDVSNLKDALETLGFVAHGDIHEKVFPEIGCSLKVDFQAKRLIYPNEKILFSKTVYENLADYK